MARLLPPFPLFSLLLFLLLPVPLPVLPLPSPPPENAAGSRCPPGRFQCHPGAFCFPAEWRCDGHPDCEDEEDERGCGTATPDGAWVTPPRSSGVPPAGGAEASATPVPGGAVPSRSQDRLWILIIATRNNSCLGSNVVCVLWHVWLFPTGSVLYAFQKNWQWEEEITDRCL
ncbi:CD320 antigen isoform X2 [Rissa tridactyla]|uniref:CD320 antigen isoform X2 n=1 Tax=Rissa tridactyla TaxID=75485 RepID=UPI0023BABB58|nr:CD320 antigen isoform X2 [Rissa tridactyla]